MEPLSTPRQLYLCCHQTPVFEVPPSFGFLRFIASLEARRDRDLNCLPMPGGASHTTAWIAGQNTDWIVYPDCGSPTRNVQALLHLTAHVILRHTGITLSGPGLAALLIPGLRDALARHVRHGTDVNCGVADSKDERHALALAMKLAELGDTAFDVNFGPDKPAA